MSRKHFTPKAIYEAALSLKQTIDSSPLNRAGFNELFPDLTVGRKRLLVEFKKITGYNFIGYQRYRRMEAASNLLLTGMTVKEVTIECGYNGYIGNFSRDFKAIFKKGPDEWLKSQVGDSKHAKKAARKDEH